MVVGGRHRMMMVMVVMVVVVLVRGSSGGGGGSGRGGRRSRTRRRGRVAGRGRRQDIQQTDPSASASAAAGRAILRLDLRYAYVGVDVLQHGRGGRLAAVKMMVVMLPLSVASSSLRRAVSSRAPASFGRLAGGSLPLLPTAGSFLAPTDTTTAAVSSDFSFVSSRRCFASSSFSDRLAIFFALFSCVFTCFARWSLRMNFLLQIVHVNRFSPVCVRKWRCSSSERVNRLPQNSHLHWKGRSPMCCRLPFSSGPTTGGSPDSSLMQFGQVQRAQRRWACVWCEYSSSLRPYASAAAPCQPAAVPYIVSCANHGLVAMLTLLYAPDCCTIPKPYEAAAALEAAAAAAAAAAAVVTVTSGLAVLEEPAPQPPPAAAVLSAIAAAGP
uniref:Uncharacterized protein n=1 Tax=Anopheles merus TaxID=30066 RepID=A0A182VL24_ANOME